MYSCTKSDGSKGLACHNPAEGCASSLTCGEGCDRVVTGRCECVQTVLCIRGDHFDRGQCKCVPDEDAGTECVDNVLCVRGDHFDRKQCKCVPNADAATDCVDNVLCVRGDHFDRKQCKCVPDMPPETTFCTSDADCPMGKVCGGKSPIKCPPNALCVPARTCIPEPVDAGANQCTTAADCKGALPALCEQCSDGSSKCAHFECNAGRCEVAICPK